MFVGTAARAPVVFTALWGEPTVADVEAMRLFYRSVHAAGRPFINLGDMRRCQMPSPTVRRALGEFAGAFEGHQLYLGSANVLATSLTIGAITAIEWFLRRAKPRTYTSSAIDALAWVEELASRHQLEVSYSASTLARELDALSEKRGVEFGAVFERHELPRRSSMLPPRS
jgi:hypothetical protein